MDKIVLPQPPIANAADYVDALIRPPTQDSLVNKRVIPGRRMRDKFRTEPVVVEVAKKLA